MPTEPDTIAVSPAILRRLARENQEMGTRLASREFHSLLAELESAQLFDLEIDFPNDPGPELMLPILADDPSFHRLPRLNVTLGSVAWVDDPDSLPVLGIFVPDGKQAALRKALTSLMAEHYSKPFARFVFLCESLRLVPFFGRYNFTFEHLGKLPPSLAARRIHQRFGAEQIRDLVSGKLLWRAPIKKG